jgi:hypothetical protein
MEFLKKFWTTLVALAALGGLLAYILLVDAKKPASNDKTKEKVFSLEKATIKEIALARAQEPLKLTKDGATWKLSEPMVLAADQGMVDILLTNVETIDITRVVDEKPASVKDFGLETPTLKVSVVGGTGTQLLEVGEKTVDGTSYYARRPGEPRVFIVPAHMIGTFDKKVFDMRDRSVMHLKRSEARQVDLKGPRTDFTLVRDDKGDWAFARPSQTRASKWGVDALLVSFENLLYDSIEHEDAKDKELKAFGLDKPVWRAAIQMADGTVKVLEVGKLKTPGAVTDPSASPNPYNDKYWGREGSRGLVGTVNGSIVSDMTKASSSTRMKYLLDFPALEVTSVEITSDGKKRSYTRSVAKDSAGVDVRTWKQTAPEAKDVETKTVEDALFDVTSTEIQEFIDTPGPLAAYGLDTPAARVNLTFENRAPGWFEISLRNDEVYARRDNDTAVFRLAGKAKDVLERFRTKL